MRYLALFATLSLGAVSFAEVKVEKVEYKGWQGAFKLSNGTVEVVVVPQIGRVMAYNYAGSPNVLWENDALAGKTFKPDDRTYRHYGGDKLWVAPQSLWNWPPDSAIDGQPWTAEPLKNGVRLASPTGTKQKVIFRREITLAEVGTEVTFRNSMENKGPRQELSVWQVTQVNNPSSVVMPFEITSAQPKGWFGYGKESLDPSLHTMGSGVLILRRSPAEGRKFGSRSLKGQLSATLGATTFFSESPAFAGSKYPDSNSAQQVYLSPDPLKYVELEHAGPLTRMETGELVLQTVKWRLQRS